MRRKRRAKRLRSAVIAVKADTDAAEAAKLAKPGKNPGSLEVSPDDVAGEPPPSFWQKAWDRLSGKG